MLCVPLRGYQSNTTLLILITQTPLGRMMLFSQGFGRYWCESYIRYLSLSMEKTYKGMGHNICYNYWALYSYWSLFSLWYAGHLAAKVAG